MNHQEKNKGVEASIIPLLKGESDEERLAGLLLSAKFCNSDDHASILKVYDAIGVQFLDRLLMTGIGKGDLIGDNERQNEDSYLLLSVTIFSALCRVPEIAASKHMVSKVPVILEILQKKRDARPSVYEECYEILILVSTASADGLTTLYESKGMVVLASQMPSLPDGSHTLELAIRLLQLMLSKLPLEITNIAYPSELSCMVMTLARQFALSHNALKFEVLHLLSAILSSKYSAPVLDALHLMSNDDWTTFIRVGIVAVLQNRVASAEKLQALVLAESVISIVGESWLIDQKNLLLETEPIPVDRCLLLVLESSRVEVAVLLNELAYLKYEASKESSAMVDSIILKQRNLGIAFSLIEKIIKLISSSCEDNGNSISESTLMKVITGLNETIGVVLDFLQDAKDHGQTKGDDLLASVRIIGSYLAETPFACKEKVQSLLEYLLSITGEDELSPFYSICFLLPMLCQITMETEGCMMLASFVGQKPVVQCLIKMIGPKSPQSEDSATIFLACDTIMNLLLKSREIPFELDGYNFVHLLGALACWTEEANDQSVVMMASSICSLIFESTSEEALLTHPNFDLSTLNSLSRLIARSLATCGKEMSDDAKADTDLHQIVSAGYARWADRFPHIKQGVQSLKHQL